MEALSAPISSLSLLLVQTQAARWKATAQKTGAHLYLDIDKSGYLFHGFSGIVMNHWRSRSLTHIYFTRPQWINTWKPSYASLHRKTSFLLFRRMLDKSLFQSLLVYFHWDSSGLMSVRFGINQNQFWSIICKIMAILSAIIYVIRFFFQIHIF